MAATTFAPAARLGAPRAAPAAPVKKIGRPAALVVSRRGAALAAPLSRRPVRAAAGETETAAAGPVTDATWDEAVLKADVPVLVDFWAPWCGPCRMIAPIIDELAVEYKGKIKAYKLNTDESPSIATEYGIRSIPTVMLFKGGQKVEVVIGAVPKSSLVQTVEKYL